MAQTITSAKQIQRKSRGHTVRQVRSNWYKVTSGETHRTYDVNLGVNGGTCTCEWGRSRASDDRRSACSHVVAAMNFRATQKDRRISAWDRPEDAERQHRPILPIGDGVILTSRVKWKVNSFKPKAGAQPRKSRAQ